MKTSKLLQRCLQNSESEAHCLCDSSGGIKVPVTGILRWCLFCFYLVSFYCLHLSKFMIPYLGAAAAGENAGLPGSCILTKYLLSSVE